MRRTNRGCGVPAQGPHRHAAAALSAAVGRRRALVRALAAAGALGGGVQSASGRAVMSWFAPEERGLALGIRQTAVPLGGAIAAGVLPALSTHVSLRAAFDALAGGCAFAAGLGVVLLRAETTGEARGDTAARPLRDRRVWLLS